MKESVQQSMVQVGRISPRKIPLETPECLVVQFRASFLVA